MKYLTTIIAIAIALILAGCGASGKQGNQPSTLTPNPTYVKAIKERPSNIPSMLASTEPCSLDGVNEQAAQDTNPIADKAKVKLIGWAGNVANGTSPEEVWLELDGESTAYVKAIPKGNRPDVAAYFNKPGLADAGWEAYADLSGLAAGTYKVRISMLDGKQGLTCDTKRTIQIK